ncbi:HD domain-containing protein [Candidatus Woesearchaeota archaeon]|nr:HD domain-containing protein [Candidatus Woesearchaeota archaeon]
MNLPSRNECFTLYDRFMLPENIRRHIEQVTKVAVFIADSFIEKGIDVNRELVERAALLHDLLKPVDFDDIADPILGSELSVRQIGFFGQLKERFFGLSHEDAAFELFHDSYPELAEAIRKHKYVNIIEPACQPFSWEEKILTYADKRVAHDQIVTLDERFIEGHRRYEREYDDAGLGTEDIERIDSAYRSLEKELFGKIMIDPDKIKEEINRTAERQD